MMEAEHFPDKNGKRHLTPQKIPSRELKKQHIEKQESADPVNQPKIEEPEKQEFEMAVANIKDDLQKIQNKMNTHGNQRLLAFGTQANQDRMCCANEFVAINWTTKYKKITRIEDEYHHRERIIEWRMKEAGIRKRFWPAERECCHQGKADTISPQTHVKLSQPWVRKKLLDWQREKFPTGIPKWWTPEEMQTLDEKSDTNTKTNGTILFKPQIPLWDRIMEFP